MTVEEYRDKAAELRNGTQLVDGFINSTYSTFMESDYVNPDAGRTKYRPPITEDLSRFANSRHRVQQSQARKWWRSLSGEERARQLAIRRENALKAAGSAKVHRAGGRVEKP